MRDVLPDAELLPKTFSRAGYRAEGSGKMLHYFIDAQSWDEYFPAKETENPFPKTMGPPKRPVSLIRGGSWQYYETDWGPINATDREYGGDYSVVEWVGERLSQKERNPSSWPVEFIVLMSLGSCQRNILMLSRLMKSNYRPGI